MMSCSIVAFHPRPIVNNSATTPAVPIAHTQSQCRIARNIGIIISSERFAARMRAGRNKVTVQNNNGTGNKPKDAAREDFRIEFLRNVKVL